jgi:UDPglucose 6-dehydrogenase
MSPLPRIGFAGLSHLGLCSAVASAARGFDTIGFQADDRLVARIGNGDLPIVEPDLDRLLAEHAARLRFTADPGALTACDIVYLSFDVPTDDKGDSDLVPIRALIDEVTPFLAPTALLVILCQVPPGFTASLTFDPHRLFYQVETLIFGQGVARALNPERFIVGTRTPHAPLPDALAQFLGAFDCPILPMRLESAELCKISINLCLVASVSVANTLADLSERLGADWAEIVPALRLDRRIGPFSYLKPGLGIAGGNLERDLVSVCRMADRLGGEAGVVRSFIADSRYRRDWLLRAVHAALPETPESRLAILGLAYKEDTASTKNSPSLALIAGLGDRPMTAYDPVVRLPPGRGPSFRQVASAGEAYHDADALVVATPWPEFRALDPAVLAASMRGKIVIDPYAILDGAAFEAAGFTYRTMGRPAVPSLSRDPE